MKTQQIRARGLDFTVDVEGPENGETVLMLHGFPQSRYAWRHQRAALAAAGYRAVAPDQRGYSPGARPTETSAYLVQEMVADAFALMDGLGADTFHLAGHDWGGQIAWMMAGANAARLKSLTVLSRPHPAAFARSLKEDQAQAGRSSHHQSLLAEGRATELRQGGMAGFRTMFERQGVPKDAADAYCATLMPPGALEAAIDWYRASAQSLRGDRPVITTRTLYVWGDADTTVGRVAAEGTPACIDAPCRFEVIPGAGHFLQDDSPARITELMVGHIGRPE